MGSGDRPATAGRGDAGGDPAEERKIDGRGTAAGSVELPGVADSGEYSAAGRRFGARGVVCVTDGEKGECGDRGRFAARRAERGRALHNQYRGDSKEGSGALRFTSGRHDEQAKARTYRVSAADCDVSVTEFDGQLVEHDWGGFWWARSRDGVACVPAGEGPDGS